MTTRGLTATLMSAFVALLICASGCSSDEVTAPPTGTGTSNLVVSAANPADGNGTLTAAATIIVNAGGTGFDEADISQTLGTIGHEVVVTWNTTTYAVNSVQSIWGTTVTSGFTQCDPAGTPCDPAKVVVDFPNQKVTFTGLVLNDAFGGTDSSTLTGTLAW